MEGLVDLQHENILGEGTGIKLNLGESRKRAIYYRKVGDEWLTTRPLPADPMSIAIYFAKGFRAKPPEKPASVQEGLGEGQFLRKTEIKLKN